MKKELNETADSRTYKMLKRVEDLSCSRCPPHRVENQGRWAKRGTQKPKGKNKRRSLP